MGGGRGEASMAQDSDDVDGVAATLVLLRDSARGAEVLLLERPQHGSFAGVWVFPGGALEASDRLAARRAAASRRAVPQRAGGEPAEDVVARWAAVRETREETGLSVEPAAICEQACWVPPHGIPKRMRTWFFVARAPAGEIRLSREESVSSLWLSPAEALERHATGRLALVPPTWVTLFALRDADTVENALAGVRAAGLRRFASHPAADKRAVYWAGDVAYDDASASEAQGARHRLDMHRLPWAYQRD